VLAFIAYYNRTMAKPFRWTYQGKPLLDMVAELVARPDNFKRSVTFGSDGDHAHDGPHASRDLSNGPQS
jgi:hypothetical protein